MEVFKFTNAQTQFIQGIKPTHKHVCCYGGTGSGKTIMFLALIIMRAGMYPKSKHLIVRGKSNSIKETVLQDFKKLEIYNLYASNPWKVNHTDFSIAFENGSYIQCIGSDQEQHFRKVQGARYSTMYINECSKLQVRHLFGSEGIMGRLTQGKVILTEEETEGMLSNQYQYGLVNGVKCYYYELVKQYYYDFNPPSKAHWTYRYFIQNIQPQTGLKITNLDTFHIGRINPNQNPYSSGDIYGLLSEQGQNTLQSLFYGEFQDIGGKFIKREYFGSYGEEIQDIAFEKMFITTDFAKSKSVTSDYNVLCVWGICGRGYLYLLDTERFKAISIEELPKLKRVYKYWENGFRNGKAGITAIYVEKPGNGDLIAVLRSEYGYLIDTDIPRSSNKFSRFSAIRGFIESGKVFLPNTNMSIRNIKVSSWLDIYLTELESFSEDDTEYEHDDIVEGFIDACQVAMTKPKFNMNFSNIFG